MRRNCRLWWPTHLLAAQPESSILFGWILSSSSSSLDIIVAFYCSNASSSSIDLEGILSKANGKMPAFLQDKCMLSLLGHFVVDSSSNGHFTRVEAEAHGHCDKSYAWTAHDVSNDECGGWTCGCEKVDGLLGQRVRKTSNWFQLVDASFASSDRKFRWLPRLHHIHWDGQVVFHLDFHVIIYETPEFGRHHFSMGFLSHSKQVRTPLNKPKWAEDLHKMKPVLDLDPVLLAMNCAKASKSSFEELVFPTGSVVQFHIACMLVTFVWKLLAVFVASVSTLVYIVVQLLHVLLIYGSESGVYSTAQKLFGYTWQNVRIHTCQILYWPVCLYDNDLRNGSCVEYVEKASVRKHFLWSSLVVDMLLGNLLGIALLLHADSACLWLANLANNVTNGYLLISCAWLMGNPAGFKLNTELAGVLGMISLNAIQIWSTLWLSVHFLFVYFIKGLAISGIIFGLTTSVSVTIDVILISTTHVSSLHWLIALLYSKQIQAIVALWHLFRGQKWNPLRQRLDSYDYTTEQHVVGSLLFTPLLLLLPTTTGFYIFFTISNTMIGFICMLLEVAVIVIRAAPINTMFLWLLMPSRFPCGIWFEYVSCENHTVGTSRRSDVLVSFLRTNSATIRQLLWPHFRFLISAVSRSSVASSAYGLLSGRSLGSPLYDIPSSPVSGLPSNMPWMFISFKKYWLLCYAAVLISLVQLWGRI